MKEKRGGREKRGIVDGSIMQDSNARTMDNLSSVLKKKTEAQGIPGRPFDCKGSIDRLKTLNYSPQNILYINN